MQEKILVIDDHEETVRVVKFILEQRGYEVLSTTSAPSGLSIAQENKPDLILLDIMMPEINGVELCRRFRADDDFNDVPIIIFTAKDQVDDKWAGFEAGADDYLTKPTDPEELDRRIRVLLRRARHVEDRAGEEESLTTLIVNKHARKSESAESDLEDLDDQTPISTIPPLLDDREAISNLFAVIGVRGGVGTTTIAINLAASLADNAGQTCLLDLDMVQGHIGLYLQQKITNKSLNDLSIYSNMLEFARNWQNHRIQEGIGLQLLLSRSNLAGQWPELSSNQVDVLVDAVAPSTDFVVMDLGHGIQPTNLPALHRAGHIIVCTKPERVSLLAARSFLKMLPTFKGRGAVVHVVMTTLGVDNFLPQPAVEEFIKHELMATIPISYREMADAANHYTPLIRLRNSSKAAEIFRTIVNQIVV